MKKIEECYAPIGEMIVKFQEIEMSFSMLLASILKIDPNTSMALSSGLSFRKRLDVLASILPFTVGDKSLCDEGHEIIKDLGICEEHRNRIVHSTWLGSSDDTKVYRHKPSVSRTKGLQGGIEEASIEEIKAATQLISEAHRKLYRYGHKLFLKKHGLISFMKE
ncbi:MAG: hypothetical protein JXQ75_22425 [Phycisphaerae bacterium]|nr:hypothetical protein [Phycisphaerae bacterium]